MSDDRITSIDFDEESWGRRGWLPASGTWIGERCACLCHHTPGYWGKGKKAEPAVCCGTLHRPVPDKETPNE